MIEKQVSVIIPAFNEEDNIIDLINELFRLENEYANYKFEIIFVNDGSSDNTGELLKKHSYILKNVKIINHYFNLGITESLVNGAEIASFNYIFFFPADLQYSVDIIPIFLNKILEGYDMVAGKRMGKYERRIVSFIYNFLCKLLFKVNISDMNSVKIFKKELILSLDLHKDWHRYLIPLASLQNKKITEIPVVLYPRKKGESKFKNKKRILIGFVDLVSVRLLYEFRKKPLLIFGSLSFVFLLFGFISGLYFSYSRLIKPLPYEPSITFVSLLIITGLLFFMIGFLGEIIIEKKDIHKN